MAGPRGTDGDELEPMAYWRARDGRWLQVGWRTGGDAGARLGAEAEAFWPGGAASSTSLQMDASIRVNLNGSEGRAVAWEDDVVLEAIPGSDEATRRVAYALIGASVFDGLAAATYFASFYVDAFYFLVTTLLFAVASVLAWRCSVFGGNSGVALLAVDAAYALLLARWGASASLVPCSDWRWPRTRCGSWSCGSRGGGASPTPAASLDNPYEAPISVPRTGR